MVSFKAGLLLCADFTGKEKPHASYISDDMVAEITDLSRNLMLSIDIVPIPTDEAVHFFCPCMRKSSDRLLYLEKSTLNMAAI